MPPKVKFTKEEIAQAALAVVRKKGFEAVTAREVAGELGVSPRPIFTWYETMDQLRGDVYELAKAQYKASIEIGLQEPIPFQGIWRQYLRFAKEEPELYKLLFLTKPDGVIGGATEALAFSQDMARESIMRIYRLDAHQADSFFRNIWLTAFSYATLMVTDDCPFTEEEILSVGREISISVLKAYKEVPGLAEGTYDRDAVFSELAEKQNRIKGGSVC